MKKQRKFYGNFQLHRKIVCIMKLTILFSFVFVISAGAVGYSQSAKLSLKLSNQSLVDALKQIEDQSEFYFYYNNSDIMGVRGISVNIQEAGIEKVLDELLQDTGLNYKMIDRYIVIKPANEPAQTNMSAQQGKIAGAVKDAAGMPLPGVTVSIKGTSTGTITQSDGSFSLAGVPDDAILVFSFVGMRSQEVPVNGKSLINVSMEEETIGLEEVVAIGYGTTQKVNLTGSVTSVSSDDIARRQVGQTSMALQGIAPGVTITQRSGQPGVDGGTIRIRGIGTLNDANPLILVDGVEMSIDNIDPASIESISVLKDASSSSIYGSRAANGVILITTKRGKDGKFAITYNAYVGIQTPTKLPNKLNAVDHMTLLNEAYANVGRSPLYEQSHIDSYNENHKTDPDRYPDTDWQKEVLNGNGVQTNHTLSLVGGTDRLRFFGEFGYLSQNGLLEPVKYKRYSVRLNTDVRISEKISGSFDLFVYNRERESVSDFPGSNPGAISYSSATGLIFGMMNKLPATQAVKYSNSLWGEGQNGVNPVAIMEDGGFYKVTETPIIGNFSLQYKPFDFLTAKVSYAPTYSQPQVKSFVNTIKTYDADGTLRFTVPSVNYMDENVNKNHLDQFYGTVTFDKQYTFGNITALGGFQYENSTNEGFSAYRDGFLFPDYPVFSAGSSSNMKNNGWASDWTLISYFGRLNYEYAGKYLFEANVRYDGSSRFSEGHKWGIFPSFSGGWRISEEKFMESLRGNIDNLKLRASWGKLGNQNIGSNYPFASTVDLSQGYISNDALQDGAAIVDLANANISWESSEMTNVGLDMTFRKKLSATFDYYYKKTTGILLRLNIPNTMGVTAPYQNAGIVENKGWDFNLNYENVIGKLQYEITVTLSDVKNKILDLRGISESGSIVNHEDHPIQSFYLYKSLGYISSADMDVSGKYIGATQFGNVQPGDIKYEDYKVDGKINTEDKQILGSTIPRYTYSLNLSLKYGNFDFQAFLQGVGKVDGYIEGSGNIPFNMSGTAYEYHKNRWTVGNPNPKAMFPRLAFGETNNTQYSDFWMKSAAYLRVKHVQLGYTFPRSLLEHQKIHNLRVFCSAENLFTFDNFWPSADPEISPGSSGAYYPQVKTFNAGLSVTF
jgi:TonB-linked SusC/RagA family outer membrane protein